MNQWREIEKKFNAMSRRERIMIAVAGVVTISMVLFSLWFAPYWDKAIVQREQLQRTLQKTGTLTQQIQLVEQALRRDPNEGLEKELLKVQQEIAVTEGQLEELTSDLVPAEKMLPVLQSLLTQAQTVRLIELASIPSEPVMNSTEEAAETVSMYRHGIELIVAGSYFDIYRFVESIESSPWQFYWHEFDYSVEQYPKAEVRIRLYTLSISQEYIRV